jgi:endonuclease/exonuclease/phosphatase family metal-dependent hydrolase
VNDKNLKKKINRSFLLAGIIFGLGVFGLSCRGNTSDTLTGATRERLVVLTYNMWHGLNPDGNLRFGEYETKSQREARLQCFYHYARQLNPDLLFLEEVNPAPGRAKRMARDLGYDYTFLIDNAGIKIGSLGIPTNLRSGLAILAKKDLRLRSLGGRKLSGPFGWINRWCSLQTEEFRYALAAEVFVNKRRVLLMSAHLHHGPEADAEIRAAVAQLAAQGKITQARAKGVIADFNLASKRRRQELENAIAFARELGLDDSPVLFAGDFNASPDSPELAWFKRDLGFQSVTKDDDPASMLMTWDHQRNPNTHFFADFVPVNQFEPAVMDAVQPIIVKQTTRLDYIFYRGFDGFLVVREAGLFADQAFDGRMCSDHFGVYASFQQP